MTRRAIALAAALVSLAAAAPAQAGPFVDRTVECLQTQSVCVDKRASDILGPGAAKSVEQSHEDDLARAPRAQPPPYPWGVMYG